VSTAGPLAGLRVVEMSGIGPAPFAAMLLGDMGAEILRIERRGGAEWPDIPILNRNRASLALDLKSEADVERCLDLIAAADILIEGYRPGVMEKLGLGPDVVHERTPSVIYGRMTGWGQTGPLAMRAGHDINYLAVAGILSAISDEAEIPAPPLNLLGDYGAGALYFVIGLIAAVVERSRSGLGQVVDAAIVDGAASLMAPILGMAKAGIIDLRPGENILNGSAAPFYRCYRCRDGGYLAVGPLEARFRLELCAALNLPPDSLGDLDNPADWPAAVKLLSSTFETRTVEEWMPLFESYDACVTHVTSLADAPAHPHLGSRDTYVSPQGVPQPAPAPRFSRTPGSIRWASPADAPSGEVVAAAWGVPLSL
jgi:alpha-methylacyl-CoA racemase